MEKLYNSEKLLGLLIRAKQYNEALDLVRKVRETAPSQYIYCFYMGVCFWKMGRTEDAIREFQTVLEHVDLEIERLKLVGDFLREIGRPPRAKRLHELYANIWKVVSRHKSEKKLLAVYDLLAQPYSIGDLIAFLIAAMIKATQTRSQRIDICFISDVNRIPLGNAFSTLMGDGNALYNLLKIIPIVQFCDNVGSVLVFSTYDEFEQYCSVNEHVLWPTVEQIKGGTYTYFEIIKLVDECSRDCGMIPEFKLPGALRVWVSEFYKMHVDGEIPVTVNLRRNPVVHSYRNSIISEWLSFFRACESRYPVKFIVVGSRSEIHPVLRNCNNVVIAKDMNTNLEQDIALLITSAFHLGASSGPSTISVLSKKPYVIFNNRHILEYVDRYKGSLVQESDTLAKFSFATPWQRIRLDVEKAESIVDEFNHIWLAKDWMASYAQNAEEAQGKSHCGISWLR